MKVFVLGIEEVSYTKKTTNEKVNAVNLHCVREVPRGLSDRVTGQMVKQFFCSGGLYTYCKSIPIGSVVDIEVEPHGKYEQVLEVTVLEKAE